MCGNKSLEMGGWCVGGVANHCGCSWRQQDHSLDLTQRGLCRAHHRASPPCLLQISIRTPQTGPHWEQLGGQPGPGTLPQPLGSDPCQPRQRWGLHPSRLAHPGWASLSLGASPTHRLLFGKRGHRFSFYSVSFSSSVPLPAALAGRSFPESDMGRNPAILQRACWVGGWLKLRAPPRVFS